ARDILEKCQHALIADASCRKLRVPNMVFVYPLRPNACAEGVLAFGEAQVISQAEEFPDVAKGIDTRRRRDRRGNDGGRAASDDNLPGITRGKTYQVCGRCRP